MLVLQTCRSSIAHRHQQTRDEAATTWTGASRPLRVGCHSAAMFGKHAARLFVRDTLRFAQKGQPAPRVRLFGFARQTWSSPRAQRHQIIRADPAVTFSGESVPLRSGCHCATSSG
jgi:hypothetical protein